MDEKKEQYRLFVDMDGTLTRFYDDILDQQGNFRIERMYEPGYFQNLRPFENMVEGLRIFQQRYQQVDVYILTAVPSGDKNITEQKDRWLDVFLPEIDSEHRIFCDMGISKAEGAKGIIGEALSKKDWLIDDYNKNLHEWREGNGSSIKCINNVNHRGQGRWGGGVGDVWNGPAIDHILSPEAFAYRVAVIMGIEKEIGVRETVLERVPEPENDEVIDPSVKNLSELVFDVEFLELDKDDSGKITGYRMYYYNPNAGDGLGAFIENIGDPLAEVAIMVENQDRNFPADDFRKEYWYDFGTESYDALVDFLKHSPDFFDYVGKDSGEFLWNEITSQLVADIFPTKEYYTSRYCKITDNCIFKPDENRGFIKELETEDFVYYVDKFESDENASTVFCSKEEDRSLKWIANNHFAYESLMEDLESVWNGQLKPVYLSPSSTFFLNEMAKDMGWEKDSEPIATLSEIALDATRSTSCVEDKSHNALTSR